MDGPFFPSIGSSDAKFIFYEDSLVPEIFKRENDKEAYALAFNYNGQRYYFSNSEGHETIYNGGHSTRPMTRHEFKTITARMLRKTKAILDSESQRETLAEISKLNYREGQINATFKAIIDHNTIKTSVGRLALNLGNFRYIYTPGIESVYKLNCSDFSGHMIAGDEKKEMIDKMKSSKTMAKVIKKEMVR